MAPLPYSGDIELISDMLEDLAALRQELAEDEGQELIEQEDMDLWPWEEAA